ncbi:hypothetical protein [Hymenobacter crusticola]|uniref:Uncharacterized protein n=1 Tax=Hymenobacter crusticola TaxID=1770526 RepID=A0A243W7D9_9BACT|nr:hypothetical protein [Hymenobacter crusticola]OUJ69068.1 hypothetical protein BXP70_27025 [Hymenobacter crusticola]
MRTFLLRLRKLLLVVLGLVLGAVALLAASILTEDPPKAGLCMAASREASVGGVWLGLYQDGTFAFGHFERDIHARGTYRFQGDTLLLSADPGTTISRQQPRCRFVLRGRRLVQLPAPNGEAYIGYVVVRRGARGACAGG